MPPLTNQSVDDIDVDKELDELKDDTPAPAPKEEPENDDIEVSEDEEIEDDPTDPEEEPEDEPDDTDDEPEDDPETEDDPEENPTDKKDPDYKNKWKASTQEAMVQISRNKKIEEAYEQAETLTVTDEEAIAANKDIDWDMATDTEKKLLKKDLLNEKKQKLIAEAIKAGKEDTAWGEKVVTFLEENSTTKYPKLSGKEEKFKQFCSKPSRRGQDFEDLVDIFLFREAKDAPVQKKGSLFNGKGKTPPIAKKQGLSTERMSQLRTKDPLRYKELIKKGKVSIDL